MLNTKPPLPGKRPGKLSLGKDNKRLSTLAVDGSEDYFISDEIPKDLEDGDDQEGENESDVDDVNPFSDSDE